MCASDPPPVLRREPRLARGRPVRHGARPPGPRPLARRQRSLRLLPRCAGRPRGRLSSKTPAGRVWLTRQQTDQRFAPVDARAVECRVDGRSSLRCRARRHREPPARGRSGRTADARGVDRSHRSGCQCGDALRPRAAHLRPAGNGRRRRRNAVCRGPWGRRRQALGAVDCAGRELVPHVVWQHQARPAPGADQRDGDPHSRPCAVRQHRPAGPRGRRGRGAGPHAGGPDQPAGQLRDTWGAAHRAHRRDVLRRHQSPPPAAVGEAGAPGQTDPSSARCGFASWRVRRGIASRRPPAVARCCLPWWLSRKGLCDRAVAVGVR